MELYERRGVLSRNYTGSKSLEGWANRGFQQNGKMVRGLDIIGAFVTPHSCPTKLKGRGRVIGAEG